MIVLMLNPKDEAKENKNVFVFEEYRLIKVLNIY